MFEQQEIADILALWARIHRHAPSDPTWPIQRGRSNVADPTWPIQRGRLSGGITPSIPAPHLATIRLIAAGSEVARAEWMAGSSAPLHRTRPSRCAQRLRPSVGAGLAATRRINHPGALIPEDAYDRYHRRRDRYGRHGTDKYQRRLAHPQRYSLGRPDHNRYNQPQAGW